MELWQIAKPFGRPAKFQKPEELWQAFLDYAAWSTNNPMQVSNERSQKNKTTGTEKVQKKEEATRPFSLVAFRLHAGIKRDWATFSADYSRKSKDFRGVIQAIEQSVRQQMVDNALVGNYKENLVARLNGISDTVKQEVSANVSTRKGMSIAEAQSILHEVESQI